MNALNKKLGLHYIIELIGCDPEKLKFEKDAREIVLSCAEKSKATILKSFFHQFDPFGVSGILLLAESHFSLHTWPEESYAAIDILTCGKKMNVEKGLPVLINGFCAKELKKTIVPRGY